MTHTQTQGADGAGTKTASAIYTQAENDEAYSLGHRDGYSEGVLDAANHAGLQLEYGVSTDPERHVPGPGDMLERISEHTDALASKTALASPRADSAERTAGALPVPANVRKAFEAADLREAYEAVAEYARQMPRETPAPGGTSTMHDFKIEAGEVWGLDRALKRLDAVLASAAPTPAPATPPGVPDSVRAIAAKAAFYALFEDEFGREDEDTRFDEAHIYWERDGAYPKMRKTAFEAADAALGGYSGEGRTLISAHPAGQADNLPDPQTAQTNLARIGAVMGLQAKPVAWLLEKPDGETHLSECRPRDDWKDGTVTPLYAAPIIQPAGQAGDAGAVQCDRCQGNGEIVTDWQRYRHPLPGDVGDEATADCPGCNGVGTVDAPAPNSTRTGAAETEVGEKAERTVQQLENAAVGGLFHCDADREEAIEIITEALWSSPLAARPEAPSDAGWSFDLTPEQKPIKGFSNRAGETDTDDAIAAELEAAGIEPNRWEGLRDLAGEVKTAVRGSLHGWHFERAWYYWVAKGPGIELAAADILHAAHPDTVRVNGHCGCPSPLEQNNGLAIGSYHVDSPAGLKGLADTIKALVNRAAQPSDPAPSGQAEN